MVIIEFTSFSNRIERQHFVLVFGVGLIGNSILNKISASSNSIRSKFKFTWGDHALQKMELNKIVEFLDKQIIEKKTGITKQIDIIWSAGKGGFYSSREVLNLELESYQNILEFSFQVSEKFSTINIGFHLFSSAGGLFEGQKFVDINSQPFPLRPYSELKLIQENMLKILNCKLNKYIYRPSSVYGYIPNSRLGLIPNILVKSIRYECIDVFASTATLRDYIFVNDISEFVKMNILVAASSSQNCEPKVYFLVTGKPSTILEILKVISNTVNRNIYNNYTLSIKNSDDNTFSPNIVPLRLNTTDIYTGISITYNEIIKHYTNNSYII